MSVGVEEVGDSNAGQPLGIGEFVEARTGGQRVIAAAAYSLDRVTAMTDTLVTKVLLSGNEETVKATGVELADGREIFAKREVIILAGAIRTPQILMLSGIGSKKELARHGIECLVDSPDAGGNLWGHVVFDQFWQLRNPNIGAAIGSTKWTDLVFLNGNPSDWYTTISIPRDGLLHAPSKDEKEAMKDQKALLATPRCHIGNFVFYAALPFDGSRVRTFTLNLLPTSRGTVILPSSDPAAKPIIDRNFNATEADRYRICTGVRMVIKMMNSPAGKEMVVGEAAPEGFKALSENSTDEEIEARFCVPAR
jgi:choline dehydrogenase-like flavoprotein